MRYLLILLMLCGCTVNINTCPECKPCAGAITTTDLDVTLLPTEDDLMGDVPGLDMYIQSLPGDTKDYIFLPSEIPDQYVLEIN